MQTGAVLMVDALGFKGIWETGGDDGPARVLAKMHGMRRDVERDEEIDDMHVSSQSVFLSDTIVVVVEAKEALERSVLRDGMLVYQAASRALWLARDGLESEPRLAYRGCISFGRFGIDPPFVLGPAIDEAATWCEQAEGAFIWLAPSAQEVWNAAVATLRSARPSILTPYPVPLKKLCPQQVDVVVPVDPVFARPVREEFARYLLATFNRSLAQPGVPKKRANTEAFIASSLEAMNRER